VQKATMAERIEAVKAMANNIFQVFDIDKSGDLDVKELGRKTPLLKPCCTKMIILPRQAQDKHRESIPKKLRFPAGALMHELEFTCDEAYLNAMVVKFGHKKKKEEGGKGGGKGVVGFEEFQTIVALIAPSLAQAAEVKAKEAEVRTKRSFVAICIYK
jgi:hypothetical protein